MQFKLPELGEGIHEGELVKWKIKEGEEVKVDQTLCEVMTDKATMEIPSAVSGKVTKIHAAEGETVHVGQVLVSFEGAEVADTMVAAEAAKAEKPAFNVYGKPVAGAAAPVAAAEAPVTAGNLDIATRPLAAPMTRRLAREMGVDLSKVSGSGDGGRIMKDDVLSFVQSSGVAKTMDDRSPLPPHEHKEERIPLKGLRKKISEKMRTSMDHAAHFTYVEEADVTELVKLRNQAREIAEKQGIKVTYLPFVMKAMVAALRKFPIINSSLDEEAGQVVMKNYYNVGLSVQTDDGLTAPIIHDVEHKNILEIAQDIQRKVERARAKKLTAEDFTDGTITLTNAGSIGGMFATPVINYPEAAIIGFNKISRRPVVKKVDGEEKIVIRDWTFFSISCDHRLIDGAVAAEFMKTFIQYIENPSLLLLEYKEY